MKIRNVIISGITSIIIIVCGISITPYVFAERVLPGIVLGDYQLAGIKFDDLSGVISSYSNKLKKQQITIQLQDKQTDKTIEELGTDIDIEKLVREVKSTTLIEILKGKRKIKPVITIKPEILHQAVQQDFSQLINPPQNATLVLSYNKLFMIPGKSGDGIDLLTFEQDIINRIKTGEWRKPISLIVVSSAPNVQDNEVQEARDYATGLLKNGFNLSFNDSEWKIKPYTIGRLIKFIETKEPATSDNYILGVTFDRQAVVNYLSKTIAPTVNQEAQDARFEKKGNKVQQFSHAQEGRSLNINTTANDIINAVKQKQTSTKLTISITSPEVGDLADITTLGLKSLLATGVSNFVGSTKSRITNIKVGTNRYHGLLISPGDEFSFNENLGPVSAAAGFKQELVIKHNKTIPEYGGGLCQVSTTIFRAAIAAGLDVVQRRNHAYVVHYYGKPGFDATIYPPYTDLRFINNTPGYILIQTRIEGTKLTVDFWGTEDGRKVEVVGPITYDWQPDGSVKAILKQIITYKDSTIIKKTFYSRYKSSKLFPKTPTITKPQKNDTQQTTISTTSTTANTSNSKEEKSGQQTSPSPTPKTKQTSKATD